MTVAAPPITKLRNYVNGRWSNPSATEWLDVTNPATGEIIARVPLGDAGEVAAAVEAAAAAFPEWRRTPPEDRIQPLFKLKCFSKTTSTTSPASSPGKRQDLHRGQRPRCAAPSKTSKSPAAFP